MNTMRPRERRGHEPSRSSRRGDKCPSAATPIGSQSCRTRDERGDDAKAERADGGPVIESQRHCGARLSGCSEWRDHASCPVHKTRRSVRSFGVVLRVRLAWCPCSSWELLERVREHGFEEAVASGCSGHPPPHRFQRQARNRVGCIPRGEVSRVITPSMAAMSNDPRTLRGIEQTRSVSLSRPGTLAAPGESGVARPS